MAAFQGVTGCTDTAVPAATVLTVSTILQTVPAAIVLTTIQSSQPTTMASPLLIHNKL
jgi:hypothetical protein